MTNLNFEKTEIVVTGLAWMGHGIRSIDSTLESLLEEAKDEVQVAAYMITESANKFIELISNCLCRGIKVTLILNRFESQPKKIQKEISKLLSDFVHFKVFNFNPKNKLEDLHAKLIVIDRQKALVGSSNITWKGLILNHELAILLKGPTAKNVGSLIDILTQDSRTEPVKI